MDEDKRDRKLEFILGHVSTPKNLWNDFSSAINENKKSVCRQKIKEYERELCYFAFAHIPDYVGFKAFLEKNAPAFPPSYYRVLKNIGEEQMDYIFERIREINVIFKIHDIEGPIDNINLDKPSGKRNPKS